MKDIEKILEAVGKRIFPHTGYTILNGVPHNPSDIPSDLNAIRELELLVIEKVGRLKHGEALEVVLGLDEDLIPYLCDSLIATADAPTRIAAMLAALEGE